MTAADARLRRSPRFWALLALAIIPLNFGVWWLVVSVRSGTLPLLLTFLALAALQLAFGLTAVVTGIRERRRTRAQGLGAAAAGALAAAGAVAGGAFGTLVALFAAGGGWGRPLRVRGRQLHPELRLGSDWTEGPRPDPGGLDLATAQALAALWLHDAQKEHASVPAFARVSWLLAAAGAPADLLAWSHRAALEEIEHAQACFALAAGYGGCSYTVEPMPELLLAALAIEDHALVVLAGESLADGCLLEDFNADVAAECAEVCLEPTTREVLLQIAREERAHADFSWAVLQWAVAQDGAAVRPAVERRLRELPAYPRPTAARGDLLPLIAQADPAQLRDHGRLPDARWAELWQARLLATTARARTLLAPPAPGRDPPRRRGAQPLTSSETPATASSVPPTPSQPIRAR